MKQSRKYKKMIKQLLWLRYKKNEPVTEEQSLTIGKVQPSTSTKKIESQLDVYTTTV
ncbi:hypothetical protein IC575_019547 [Cucumis melo]